MAAAEKVLAAVSRFHDSARDSGQRDAGWGPLRDRLRKKLLDVQLERLRMMVDGGEWAKALDYASRLARSYPEPDVQIQLAQSLGRLVEQSLKSKNYEEARVRLGVLEQQFHNKSVTDRVSDVLRSRAQELLDQAREKEKDNDKAKAMELVLTAESIWPSLPGLQDYHLKLSNQLPPTLEVGVSDLPEKLSPSGAVTDSERQAVEMLFESLVRPVDVEGIGQEYVPVLAQRSPQVVPLGRQFQLVSDACWSDGQPVRSGDVVFSLKRQAPQCVELLDAIPPRDPLQVNIKLRQGFIEPLSLMSFKILPEHSHAPNFDEQPIGSGPFRLEGRQGDAVVFSANENYRRKDKPGQPQIRQIRFFHSANPIEDFVAGRLHVLLDLPPESIRPLLDLPSVQVRRMQNRRIYFLAVNHCVPFLKNQDVRKAIAHAIDRKRILDDVFRGPKKDTPDPPHRVLNGPYPPGSWAYAPASDQLREDPRDRDLARAFADRIKKRVTLHLKYPDERKLREACEAIRTQVKEATDIELGARAPFSAPAPRRGGGESRLRIGVLSLGLSRQSLLAVAALSFAARGSQRQFVLLQRRK